MVSPAAVASVNKTVGAKDLATVFAVTVAAVYALGLLITNISLAKVGYTDFNLLRPRCILTGGWAAFLILTCGAPGYFGIYRAHFSKSTWKRDIKSVFAVLTITLSLAVAIGVQALRVLKVPVDRAVLEQLLELILILIAGMAAFRVFLEPASNEESGERSIYRFAAALTMLAITLFCLGSISENFYRSIPQSRGGGKPELANLVLTVEGGQFWRKVTTQTPPTGEMFLSSYVYVYHESESHLVVKICECVRPVGDILIIDKKLVAGIIPEFRDPNSITPETARPTVSSAPAATRK